MKTRLRMGCLVLAILAGWPSVAASQITITYSFSNGSVADADQVNANFTALGTQALNRTGGTMTGTLTAQQITPSVTNTYDLGTSSVLFRTGYLRTSLVLGQAAGNYTIAWNNPAANRALTLPDPGGADTFAFLDATQTFTNKTLTSPTISCTGCVTWTNLNKTGSSLADLATRAVANLSDGSNVALLNANNVFTGNMKVAGTTAGGLAIGGNFYSHVLVAGGYNAVNPLNETHQVTFYAALHGNSFTNNVDGFVSGFETALGVDDAVGTVPNIVNFDIGQITKGAGNTITRTYGYAVYDETAGTNNVAIGNYGSGFTGDWLIYYSGSRASYLGTGALIPGNEVYRKAADDYLRVSGGSSAGDGANIGLYGSTHATFANQAFLNASGGTTISGPVLFGTTAMKIHGASGGVSIGDTTDPGATNLRVAGTGRIVGAAYLGSGTTAGGWGINAAGDWTVGASSHIADSVGTPSVTSGATNIAGTDYAFKFDISNMGTPAVIAFGHTWSTAPICTSNSAQSLYATYTASVSTTSISIGFVNATGGTPTVYVLCRSY